MTTADQSQLAPDLAADAGGLDRDRAVNLYRTMVRIRTFEEHTERLFLDSEIPGFVHLSIGQEAVAAGVCGALRTDDYLTSTHRGHGHTLAKGADPGGMMAELFGREEGICRGRGGSMHIADFSIGMLGANAIVAGGLGIAVGAGLSAKLRGTDQVAVSFFGDGATGRGPFHESLNLAAVWDLPVVFVCEHNGWASTTAAADVLAVEHAAERAAAYRMPALSVDGNDVFAVHVAALEAVDRGRSGGGPTLLEARTYRMKGHFVGDPMKYRGPEELDSWAAKDPIALATARLREAGILDDVLIERIRDEAQKEMDQAIRYARAGTEPDPADVAAYLYAT